MFRKIFSRNKSIGLRALSVVRRKYPINPEDVKKLPILDQPVSKKSYRRVFVCGSAETGALGIPFSKTGNENVQSKEIKACRRLSFAEKNEVTHITAGFGFTLFAVNSDSNIKLYGTGINTDSQIGQHVLREGHPLEVVFSPRPVDLPLLSAESKILKLSAGRAHSAVLTDEGLFLLGNNAYGQCGRYIIPEENYIMSNFIHHIQDIEGKKIIDVECGQDHTLAITLDGSVYACGWGADGQTGQDHFDNTETFQKVRGDIKHEKITKLSSKSDFVLALSDKGEVFGWGNMEYGQMMTTGENQQQLCTPTHIKRLNKLGKFIDVASGRCFCVVLNENGDVFTWGYGILGAGPQVQQSLKPVNIPQILFGRNDFQPNSVVIKVKCGLNHILAITNLGEAYVWGRNKGSCLGLGNDKDQYFPLKVSLGGLVEDVACGVDHTIFLCKPFI